MATTRGGQAPVTTRAPLTADQRGRLGRRAQLLAGASVTYNLLEAAIAVAAGTAASSIALIGFGLDSLVEVGSGLVILWQFRHPVPESREKQALKLIAISFFALAAYVSVQSVRTLLGAAEPEGSGVGIALATASLAIMPFLSWAQRRTGRELGSGSVVADSKQTLLCTYLSAVLLGGLVLNATLGWSWADPLAGLVIAAVAAREGREAWRGENCGCGPSSPADDLSDGCADACCATSDRDAPDAGARSAASGPLGPMITPRPAAYGGEDDGSAG